MRFSRLRPRAELAGSPVRPATAAAQGQPVKGALIYLCALLFFAGVDGTTKLLAGQYPVPLIAALRYATQLAIMFAFLPRPRRTLLVTRRPELTLARSLSLTGVTIFMGFALARLPLAEATSVAFLAPLLVSLLAGPLLGEKLTPVRLLAVLGGFLGVLVIVRPGGSHFDLLGTGFAFAAAACNTVYQLLSRVLNTEPPMKLLYHSVLVGAVVFGLLLPLSHGGPTPDLRFGLLIALLAAFGGIGHLLLAYAFQLTPASLLAPLTYLQLLWAAAYGYFVFKQLPDRVSLLGMFIVAASGVMVALSSRQSAPLPLPDPGPESPR